MKLFLFFLFFAFNLSSYAISLKLCFPDNDAPPWQIGNGEYLFNPPGLSLDVISKAANDLKINLIYTRVPTNRVFAMLKRDEADGVFIFSYLPERLQDGVYPLKNGELDHSRRVATMDYHFYKSKSSTLTWDGQQLKNLKTDIGVNRGYAVIDILKKMQIGYEESKGSEILVKKVSSGRIDALVAQSVTVDLFISKLKITNLIKLTPPVISKDYFLVFGKNFYQHNKDLCEKFWSQIGKVRDSTIVNNIAKYED